MKMRRLLLFMSIMILLSIISAGCKAETAPSPTNANTSNTPAVIAKTPAVSGDMGALHIVLLYSQSGDPVRGQNIYLAEMKPLQGATEGVYAPVLDTNTAFGAESTSSGNVVMSLVTPGKYALAILTPIGAQLVVDSESNREITFDIKAGEVTDLGSRNVDLDQDFLEPKVNP